MRIVALFAVISLATPSLAAAEPSAMPARRRVVAPVDPCVNASPDRSLDPACPPPDVLHDHVDGVAIGAFFGGSAVAAGGILVSSTLHGERRRTASLELAGGALGAAAPMYLVESLLAEPPNTEVAAVARFWQELFTGAQFTGGLALSVTLSGLGTWGAGELQHGSQSRNLALAGAMTGAAFGTAVASLATRWAARRSPGQVKLLTFAASTVVASMSNLGYQLLGGGPR